MAAALSRAGGPVSVIEELLGGTATAAWCLEEPGGGDPVEGIGVRAGVDGTEVVLTGTKRPIEGAATAQHFLVTARTDGGLIQVLVPSSTEGVVVAPMQSVDLTRRFSVVTFEGARVPVEAVVGQPGHARQDVEEQLQFALVIGCAESVGAMERAFDMTVEWAFDRYSFGRPLASYQELKHRFADMKTWLEASHALADAAARAVQDDSADADELASAAKAYIGNYGPELCQECVQMHGGIGVTFEHDMHLFLRRVTLDSLLYGTVTDHRLRLTDILEAKANEKGDAA